jgi:hypothetical protein
MLGSGSNPKTTTGSTSVVDTQGTTLNIPSSESLVNTTASIFQVVTENRTMPFVRTNLVLILTFSAFWALFASVSAFYLYRTIGRFKMPKEEEAADKSTNGGEQEGEKPHTNEDGAAAETKEPDAYVVLYRDNGEEDRYHPSSFTTLWGLMSVMKQTESKLENLAWEPNQHSMEELIAMGEKVYGNGASEGEEAKV